MAKYEMDLIRRRILKDGKQILALPNKFDPEDEIFEVIHIDPIQLEAIQDSSPVSVEASDLLKVTFKIDPTDRFSLLQRQTQVMGAYVRRWHLENPQEPNLPQIAEAATDG